MVKGIPDHSQMPSKPAASTQSFSPSPPSHVSVVTPCRPRAFSVHLHGDSSTEVREAPYNL